MAVHVRFLDYWVGKKWDCERMRWGSRESRIEMCLTLPRPVTLMRPGPTERRTQDLGSNLPSYKARWLIWVRRRTRGPLHGGHKCHLTCRPSFAMGLIRTVVKPICKLVDLPGCPVADNRFAQLSRCLTA